LDFSVSEKKKGISNNEAEFKAIILGIRTVLHFLQSMQLKTETAIIKFHSDSQIIVNRMNGSRAKGRYANKRMDNFQDQALKLVGEHFTKELVSFNWIPREKNEKADELSKKACELTLE
jgi:ribonuclease HI